MKGIFTFLIFTFILILAVFFMNSMEMKDMGFTEFNPDNPLKYIDTFFTSLDNNIGSVSNQDLRDYMNITAGETIYKGDKINVVVIDSKKRKPLKFTFTAYFPYREEVFVKRKSMFKERIYRIDEDKILISIIK